MIKEFPLPDLGEGLTESEIVAWRVAVGDRVELNQIIADVETAKAVNCMGTGYSFSAVSCFVRSVSCALACSIVAPGASRATA